MESYTDLHKMKPLGSWKTKLNYLVATLYNVWKLQNNIPQADGKSFIDST
jgi:hypothetical protein